MPLEMLDLHKRALSLLCIRAGRRLYKVSEENLAKEDEFAKERIVVIHFAVSSW